MGEPGFEAPPLSAPFNVGVGICDAGPSDERISRVAGGSAFFSAAPAFFFDDLKRKDIIACAAGFVVSIRTCAQSFGRKGRARCRFQRSPEVSWRFVKGVGRRRRVVVVVVVEVPWWRLCGAVREAGPVECFARAALRRCEVVRGD